MRVNVDKRERERHVFGTPTVAGALDSSLMLVVSYSRNTNYGREWICKEGR